MIDGPLIQGGTVVCGLLLLFPKTLDLLPSGNIPLKQYSSDKKPRLSFFFWSFS
jgi:hypothetical protein